jgi:hypothetical protein
METSSHRTQLTYLSSLGGATATAPAGGFENNDLAVYFTQHASIASRSPTRAIPNPTKAAEVSSSRKVSTGAVAGIAVGGAVVLIAVLVGASCCICRHRRKKLKTNPQGLNHPAHQSSHSQVERYPHPHPESQSYQLPAPVPVELSANNYQMQMDPKDSVHHVHESPRYVEWQTQSPVSHVSSTISPHPSIFSHGTQLSTSNKTVYGSGSQTSPAPTYASLGRTRKPVPSNQTCYSP